MSQELQIGIIGTGRPWKSDGATGTGIAHQHAKGYRASPHARIVALCDLSLESAESFRELHGGDRCYTDARTMFANEKLDLVSVCTWPGTHSDLVLAAIDAGVKAIHCEKPMAPTWAEAKRMHTAATAAGIQLTFNHQRRFDPAYVKAKRILKSGRIGELKVLEMPTANLFDWGTHWFDMMHFYNDEAPAEWVLAAVEPTGGSEIFKVLHESSGVCHVKFSNGVHGYVMTGDHGYPYQNRIVGSQGAIEIGFGGWDALRVRADHEGIWESIDTKPGENEHDGFALAIFNVIDSLRLKETSELSSDKALRATELVFAAYESSRNGGRVNLPLAVEDATIHARNA